MVVYTGLRSDSIKNHASRNVARRIATMRIIFTRIGCTLLTCDMHVCDIRYIHDPVLSSLKMEGIRLLDVLCRSTCFGRLHAHHQELTTALTQPLVLPWSVEVAALLVVAWPAGQTTTNNDATTTLQGKTRGC
jgi:hypothetical protein